MSEKPKTKKQALDSYHKYCDPAKQAETNLAIGEEKYRKAKRRAKNA